MTENRKTLAYLKGAGFCEGVGATMLLIFVPFHVRSALQEPSLTLIALIISFPALTTLVSSNFWGALADVAGYHGKVTSICLFGFTASLFLIPFLEQTATVVASVAMLSLLYGATRPMLLSQATLLQEDEKPKALSTIFIFESLGFFVGGLLFYSSLALDRSHAGIGVMVFPVAGIFCLTAALVTLMLPKNPAATTGLISLDTAPKLFLKLIKNDLLDIYQHRLLRKLLGIVLITSISNFCFFGMYFAYFTEGVGGSSGLMSLTLSLSTVTGMLVFPVARRWVDSIGGERVLMISIFCWILNYLFLSITRNPYVASALFITPIYPLFLVSANALAADASRSERRGGGLGAVAGCSALSMALGSVLGGVTGDVLSPRAIPCISAGLSTIALIAFFMLYGLKTTLRKEG
ncbi:MAG: MFS transporter [Planctomycetota bacterium]|jgi:MFS family permease